MLIALSPSFYGSSTEKLGEGVNFAIFPMSNPGIVSIPLAFILGIVGTFLGNKDEFTEKKSETEVRSLTGGGRGKDGHRALSHTASH